VPAVPATTFHDAGHHADHTREGQAAGDPILMRCPYTGRLRRIGCRDLKTRRVLTALSIVCEQPLLNSGGLRLWLCNRCRGCSEFPLVIASAMAERSILYSSLSDLVATLINPNHTSITMPTNLSVRLAVLLAALPLIAFATSAAGSLVEKELALTPETDIAAGATRMGGQFAIGGLEGVGLFIGNPNTLPRADRVVMTFDLDSLLRDAGKVKSAKLVFYVDYFFGPEETREIEAVVFDGQLNELTEESLSSFEVESVATVEVASADQNKGGQAQGMPYEVDVTNQLIQRLKSGKLNISLRLRDVLAESQGNPNLESAGVLLDKRKGFLPRLVVQMEQ